MTLLTLTLFVGAPALWAALKFYVLPNMGRYGALREIVELATRAAGVVALVVWVLFFALGGRSGSSGSSLSEEDTERGNACAMTRSAC